MCVDSVLKKCQNYERPIVDNDSTIGLPTAFVISSAIFVSTEPNIPNIVMKESKSPIIAALILDSLSPKSLHTPTGYRFVFHLNLRQNLFPLEYELNCLYLVVCEVLIRVQTHIRGTSSVLQYQHM